MSILEFIFGLSIIITSTIYIFTKKRKFPNTWEIGDVIEEHDDDGRYTYKLTHLSPDRKTAILNGEHIVHYRLLSRFSNETYDEMRKLNKLNKIKSECEDYTTALKEIKEKFK